MRDKHGHVRVKEPSSDIETLKAWCHWKRVEIGNSMKACTTILDLQRMEDMQDLLTAIENLISQVGTWKAKYEQLKEVK